MSGDVKRRAFANTVSIVWEKASDPITPHIVCIISHHHHPIYPSIDCKSLYTFTLATISVYVRLRLGVIFIYTYQYLYWFQITAVPDHYYLPNRAITGRDGMWILSTRSGGGRRRRDSHQHQHTTNQDDFERSTTTTTTTTYDFERSTTTTTTTTYDACGRTPNHHHYRRRRHQ